MFLNCFVTIYNRSLPQNHFAPMRYRVAPLGNSYQERQAGVTWEIFLTFFLFLNSPLAKTAAIAAIA